MVGISNVLGAISLLLTSVSPNNQTNYIPHKTQISHSI